MGVGSRDYDSTEPLLPCDTADSRGDSRQTGPVPESGAVGRDSTQEAAPLITGTVAHTTCLPAR